MKTTCIVLLFVATSMLSSAQSYIDEVFNKYSGKTGYTTVSLSPDLIKLISLLDKEDQDLKTMSDKLTSFRLLISEHGGGEFTAQVANIVLKEKYLSVMEIVEGKQRINFYVKQDGNSISDFIMLSIDDKEEVLLSISGDLKLNEISNLGHSSSFSGSSAHISLLRNLESM